MLTNPKPTKGGEKADILKEGGSWAVFHIPRFSGVSSEGGGTPVAPLGLPLQLSQRSGVRNQHCDLSLEDGPARSHWA